MPLSATRLGPYEIVAPLGSGGMGEVYRARDTRLGREVAVKVLPEAFANDGDRRARFEREARAVAALSHPNILAIHDYGSDGAVTYAVMELLEGETLRGRLQKGPLPWREAVDIGAAIAEGLAAAHAKGIIHRDLKPDNLFLTSDGRVKILDFGLARIAPPAADNSETSPYVPAGTDPGTVMGTVGYMSPEQVRAQPTDAASDLFSLGCVLYEMVTGQRAFQRETAAETMTAILREEPPDPTVADNQVPMELSRLIRQCLAKNPAHRLHSARDLGLALRATLSPPTKVHSEPPTVEATLAHPIVRRPSRSIAWALAALVLATCVVGGIYLFTRDRPDVEPTPPAVSDLPFESVAVLPFVNEAADPQAAFLGDGMTISLVNSLSQVRDLKVRPFSSVTRHKSGDSDPLTVGRELQVEAVLTGRIQQLGEDLLITIELIDVSQRRSLWIEQYQRKYANLLAVQQEIARATADKLRLRLSGEEAGQLARQPTQNLEAFRLYILGRVEWNKRTEEGLKKGINHFEQAIQEDPNYALAYAGLADSYHLLGYNHVISPKEAAGKARSAAAKALEKDANLAEAHTSLANIQAKSEWDWAGAERQFKQAIQLRPTYPTAHHWYSMLLAALGRHDEAVAEARQAQKLDPSSLIINNTVGAKFYYARRPDDAIEQYRKTLAIDPNFPPALYHLGLVYAQQGMYPEAIAEFQKAHQHSKRQTVIRGFLGYAYAKSGQETQARQLLAELQELAKRSYVSSYSTGLIYLGLGDKDQAFTCLHQAVAERDPWLITLKVEPLFDELRADPRFDQVLQDMGLAEKGAAKDAPLDTLAVLPFENQSTDPEAGYLGDDITYSLTDNLARLRDLKVRPYSSTSRYQPGADVRLAGKELQVQAVLKGSIQKRGQDVVIDVELIDVREDKRLWGQRYPGKLADRLALQQRIAEDVPEKLRLTLTRAQKADLSKLPTRSLKAHELYVRGRLEWNQRTTESMRRAIDLFQQAIDTDKGFALAYVGLADSYFLLSEYGTLAHKEGFAKARAAVQSALKIDDNLAEARATLAAICANEWDWEAAETAFQQALLLRPHQAKTHHWYCHFLSTLGRLNEALATARRAVALDPDAPMVGVNVAIVLLRLNQPEEAIRHLENMSGKNPDFVWIHHVLASAYARAGRTDDAIRSADEACRLAETAATLSNACFVYALAGQEATARKLLQRLEERAARQHVPFFDLASARAALGEMELAMTLLEKAAAERESRLLDLRFDPAFKSLHQDPRFHAVLRKMGLAP